MVVVQDGPQQENEKPLRIYGDPQKVEHAKQLVYDLIAEKEMEVSVSLALFFFSFKYFVRMVLLRSITNFKQKFQSVVVICWLRSKRPRSFGWIYRGLRVYSPLNEWRYPFSYFCWWQDLLAGVFEFENCDWRCETSKRWWIIAT